MRGIPVNLSRSQLVADAVNAGIAGGMSGAVATGKLKGALLGAGQAVAMAGVHFIKTDELGFPENAADYSAGQTADSAIMHGAVGGLFSIGQKGGFQSGFIAGGLSDLATTTDSHDLNGYDLVKSATVGGIGSVLGGGKFENGATTGAFGYLFNDLAHDWAGEGAVGGAIVGGVGLSAACDASTGGVCALGNAGTFVVGSAAGAPIGYAMGYAAGTAADQLAGAVHGNSYQSMRPNEVYYLINNSTQAIDKIGCTCDPAGRYSQAFLPAENVRCVTVWQTTWRYPAVVTENILLTHYYIEHGELPRLNQTFR